MNKVKNLFKKGAFLNAAILCFFALSSFMSCKNAFDLSKKSSISFTVSRQALQDRLNDGGNVTYQIECILDNVETNKNVTSLEKDVNSDAKEAKFTFSELDIGLILKVTINVKRDGKIILTGSNNIEIKAGENELAIVLTQVKDETEDNPGSDDPGTSDEPDSGDLVIDIISMDSLVLCMQNGENINKTGAATVTDVLAEKVKFFVEIQNNDDKNLTQYFNENAKFAWAVNNQTVELNNQNKFEFNPRAEYVKKGLNKIICKVELASATKLLDFNLTIEEELPIEQKMILVPGMTVRQNVGARNFAECGTSPITINSFYMSEHLVTQAEFEKYVSWDGKANAAELNVNYPVNYVNSYDVYRYCNLRSVAEGFEPCYYYVIDDVKTTETTNWQDSDAGSDVFIKKIECDTTKNGYRVPTFAEWEFAARGGAKNILTNNFKYPGSDEIDEVCWHSGNSGGNVHKVMTKKPNQLGIYDLSGNLWDLVDAEKIPDDKIIKISSYHFVGGNYGNTGDCAIETQIGGGSYQRVPDIGFRVVRTVNDVIYTMPDGSTIIDKYTPDKTTADRADYQEQINSNQVYAWEGFDGNNYHYLFEGQIIPATLADDKNGNINLKLVTLTLGDVVLENHKIIPDEEEIYGRTPIGVLASLQTANSSKKAPLRVLSYKEETGLAWCSNMQDEGYNDVLAELASINEKPCPLTGQDSFEYFKKTIYTDKGRTFDLYKFPIFKAASEMTDGGLTWYIPHGWELLGCTSDEIRDDVTSNESLINKGFEKLNYALGGAEQLYSPLNSNQLYWTSTMPDGTDGNSVRALYNFGWQTVEKKSTEPFTRFMAVLD